MYTAFQVWSPDILLARFIQSYVQSNNDDEDTAPFTIHASGMKEMVDIAALNSRIKFDKTDVPFDQRAILGDATETGLTRFAGRSLSLDYDAHLKQYPKVFEGIHSQCPFCRGRLTPQEVPFNSTNKWALVIVRLRLSTLSSH